MAISNKYKDTLNNLIDKLDTESLDQPESLDWLGLIDKGIYNAPRSKNTSLHLLEEDRLDENVSITALEQAPKIRDFQVYKRQDVVSFSL